MGLEESVERVREALIKRTGRKSYLLPKGLVESIADDLDETPLTVKQCMGRLAKETWLDGVSPDGTPFGHVTIIGYVPVEPLAPEHQQWLDVMAEKGIPGQDQAALTPLSTKLAPFSISEKASILEGLLQLRANLSAESGRQRFLVSAKYLLGSSKLLDELPTTALRTFGIPLNLFPSHPLYVVVAGCQNPEAVVLVENPASFELAATTSAADRCAFVSTFGFGLSKASEDFGNQLAGMIEDGFSKSVTLVREGFITPSAKDLLTHPNITFWGDLDIAGMQIFERIAKHIPAIQLSALYKPMIEAITTGNRRHPYVSAVGKSGQTIFQAGRKDSLMMLEHCKKWAVDQEIVPPAQIEQLATKKLLCVT